MTTQLLLPQKRVLCDALGRFCVCRSKKLYRQNTHTQIHNQEIFLYPYRLQASLVVSATDGAFFLFQLMHLLYSVSSVKSTVNY